MMKITPKQVERVHRLVRELCANCDGDGNCILLDDGEAHRCVQLISIYGIYCNYFKEAVLPSDRELYEQIKKNQQIKVRKSLQIKKVNRKLRKICRLRRRRKRA